ncbi:acyl carrier protein [Myxococcus sp. K15C18031901]|uniref:acyl carrier protein n=1 Tax=Myxococcus dinghuensis TaxID=2906761 RepID=UPI0020A80D70|nr:acyl carrier protein [Myxococcus dinghuensis]MCP3102338.1 acyl carrier protein [Myxococcus dinghuensis]
MELVERIGRALRTAGMEDVPTDTSEPLASYGMDSLLMVLSVAALEKEFALRISGHDFSESCFDSLDTLAAWLRRSGAT